MFFYDGLTLPADDNSSLSCTCSSRGIPVTLNVISTAGTPTADVKPFVIPENLPNAIRVSDHSGNPRLLFTTTTLTALQP